MVFSSCCGKRILDIFWSPLAGTYLILVGETDLEACFLCLFCFWLLRRRPIKAADLEVPLHPPAMVLHKEDWALVTGDSQGHFDTLLGGTGGQLRL